MKWLALSIGVLVALVIIFNQQKPQPVDPCDRTEWLMTWGKVPKC